MLNQSSSLSEFISVPISSSAFASLESNAELASAMNEDDEQPICGDVRNEEIFSLIDP
jgi:hypothetical protein